MILNEIFSSIDGEGLRQGELATFLRFAGCNLKCSYCDTEYAQEKSNGNEKSIEDIFSIVAKLKNKNITITGGEPLLQSDMITLVKKLAEEGYFVNIETNGSLDIKPYQLDNVMITIDYKTTSSLMKDKMELNNFYILREQDVLKFVIGTKQDMEDVKEILKKPIRAYVYLSPVYNKIEPKNLVDLLKELKEEGFDTSKTKVQVQLHKIIWGSEMRGV